MATVQVDAFEPPRRDSPHTLVEQITAMLASKITALALRPGSRLPSIRAMAAHLKVSPFTMVEAYEQLAAQGWLQARRGSGYFVCGRASPRDQNALNPQAPPAALASIETPRRLDVAWLLQSTLRDVGGRFVPGTSALLPHQWLDAQLLAGATRSVGRAPCNSLLGYGEPRGYAPLRRQLAEQLQGLGIAAEAEHHLLLTSGVTHAVDLVLRALTQPGDTVLVEDPAWFLVFGRLAAAGVQVLGVPRTPAGPDLQVLEQLAIAHRPRLFFINSAVHNPTGYSLSARTAHHVLKLAQAHNFHILEDDTYGELHPGGAIRLAALDGLERVLHTGGFSKTLAAGLRVAYLAAAPALIERLTDLKLLSGLTTPELSERVVQNILGSGHYQRHVQRLRLRVDAAREQALQFFHGLGLRIDPAPAAGMFLWLDCHQDSEALARRAAAHGLLLAPGRLFSPTQAPGTHLRVAVSVTESPPTMALLQQLLTDTGK